MMKLGRPLVAKAELVMTPKSRWPQGRVYWLLTPRLSRKSAPATKLNLSKVLPPASEARYSMLSLYFDWPYWTVPCTPSR